jgi:serine protease inhibitor
MQLLFLINAIYFKGNWETPFDKSQTANKTFSLTDSSSKQHPMMSQSRQLWVLRNRQISSSQFTLRPEEGALSYVYFLARFQ